MTKPRISPLQRNVLQHLKINLFVYASSLTPFQRKPYEALQRKGLIQSVLDDNGNTYWELK